MSSKLYSVEIDYIDCKVAFFGFEASASKRVPPVWHNHIFYEIHFSFGADIEYTFSDEKFILKKGEMIIIPPNVPHQSVDAYLKPQDFTVLSMEITKIGEEKGFYDTVVSALNDNALKPIRIPNVSKETVLALGTQKLYGTVLGICRLKMLAAEVVYGILNRICEDRTVKIDGNKTDVLIDRLILQPHVTLDDIASSTNYSKRQISRIIKEQYGVSFSQIRRNMQKDDEIIEK